MTFIEKLALDNPKKLNELAAFHWFSSAYGLAYSRLEMTESPDFVVGVDDRTIGIEITEAHRQIDGSPYSFKQVEVAQRGFAEGLLEVLDPALPLEVGLCFNDDVPVGKDESISIKAIAAAIRSASEKMSSQSVKLLVRDSGDMQRSGQEKLICPEIPDFLQYIQLFNDGHEFSLITGMRGGVVPTLSKEEIDAVLEKKHKALSEYQHCDEHWLVIVTGTLPPIISPNEPPRLIIPSVSTAFSGLGFELPVTSEFDRVFFFESPARVTLLTE